MLRLDMLSACNPRSAGASSGKARKEADMPVLYLHVGHSKTGTSWMQAALRENAAALAGHGLAYPTADDAAKGGEIGQGNGLALAVSPEALEAGLRAVDRAACPAGAVFSSEEFFPRLGAYDDPAALSRAALAAGFERTEILLFIRNPVGHAASLWQQYLKRGGGAISIEAFFDEYRVPELAARFLERFAPANDIGLTCLNYDRHRRDLLAPLCVWLGLPAGALSPPQAPTVNRGMTRAELALQAALNRRIGRAGRILSDALCAGLPDLPPDRIRPDPARQRAMYDRLARTLARANAYLPEAERYRPDIDPEPQTDRAEALCFTPEQVEAIGAGLGRELRRLHRALAAERQAFGPFGRNVEPDEEDGRG